MNISIPDLENLRSRCVDYVARELARPLVKPNEGWEAWPARAKEMRSKAEAKINEMSNLELLDLIEQAVRSA